MLKTDRRLTHRQPVQFVGRGWRGGGGESIGLCIYNFSANLLPGSV